jgi:uncharacterized membrane protein (UPF0182 family)
VAVLVGDRVGLGTTLADALASAGLAIALRPQSSIANAPVSREATIARLYDAMRQSIRRGDWSRFGAAFDSLGQILGRPPQ